MRYFLIFLSCVSLTACQTYEAIQDDVHDLTTGNLTTARIVENEADVLLANECPKVEIVGDLSTISDFNDPRTSKSKNLISRVAITNADATCELSSKTATVDLKLIFEGTLGPKGRARKTDKPFFSYPFFVAVTTPSGKILAKEIFAASMTYNANEDTHTYFENMRQIIPIKNKKQAKFYSVLIGFQVTPDQLKYNREFLIAAKAAKKKKPTK